ncbi:hypothetical protein CEXT_721641 [Caerostris extrusa]|uniref:Uncharacterized protein n=1 Tax=Caerostris extrusa TaxID=172846 RepID=A0AAV4N1V4_CAEEX|nr:hypothetical protein CEXT_721641 [Caerostris extrusa]
MSWYAGSSISPRTPIRFLCAARELRVAEVRAAVCGVLGYDDVGGLGLQFVGVISPPSPSLGWMSVPASTSEEDQDHLIASNHQLFINICHNSICDYYMRCLITMAFSVRKMEIHRLGPISFRIHNHLLKDIWFSFSEMLTYI